MYYHTEIFKKVDVIVTPTTGYDDRFRYLVAIILPDDILTILCLCAAHSSICGSAYFIFGLVEHHIVLQ